MVTLVDGADALVHALRDLGVERNVPVAVALVIEPPRAFVGFATAAGLVASTGTVDAVVDVVATVERELRPRWVWWQRAPAASLVEHGVRLAACWDLGAVHRVIHGGWRVDEVRIWCAVHGLDRRSAPVSGQLDLGAGDAGDGPHPGVRADGHLRAEWVDGAWRDDATTAARWAELALQVQSRQATELASIAVAGDATALARSESAAEILCAELEHDGLPIDLVVADELITSMAGPRPASEAEADRRRAERDAEVMRHLPPGGNVDLRNPADVKAMLRRVSIEVPDTRAWRLEALRDTHPVVDALLQWRKAERIATTFGHGWLDQHVGADGRLRGAWSSTDGAAGRMTAQAGLHNLPAELRPAVRADPGWVFVQADLGQIEPRVLAAVSGDRGLIQATTADDLYRPVADRLRVERPIAKVAVLAAMYGQTSGTAGQALQGMERAYPVAMQYLRDADRAGREGRELRTFGGRLIPMYETVAERDRDPDEAVDDRSAAAALAARGRYARNATVQGAAAELFKAWAATVRARLAGSEARIVLCLHDELIVHTPASEAERVAATVSACLDEASGRWFRGSGVRFVTDVQIVQSWADAKG
ncbi:MAG: DNA polymerase [Acidimicrobiales bacterium]